jgi:hypothetical protein
MIFRVLFFIAFFANVFLCPSIGAELKLTSSPLHMENLGKLVESATLEHRVPFSFYLPQTGQFHQLLYYVVPKIWKHPFQVLDINLNTGQTRVVDALLGRPGPHATILHSNGLIYIGSGDPGYFMVYDPETGQTRQIAKLADKGAQYMIEGDDGAIYIGECVKGYVERYDPKTHGWENYGIIDDPGPPYYRYAYTLGADKRYIYIAMGENPWYLVIYDRKDHTSKVYWKNLKARYVGVVRGKDGHWYAQCSTRERGTRWYRLQGNQPPELLQTRPAVYKTNFSRQGTISRDYDIDLDRAIPDTGNGGRVVIRWRKKGQLTWREASAQLRMGPFPLKRLYDWSGAKLFGFTSFYGPVFTYAPAEKKLTILGRPQRSLYDALFCDGRWWLAGYPAATMEYDPARPWSLTASTKDLFDPLSNPHLLRLPANGSAKYHFYLTRGADGFIYVGGHRERDSVGGTLGWFNPHTGITGGLRAPFRKYEIHDLIPVLHGTKILVSTFARDQGNPGKLFLFDTRQKKIEREFIPLPGERNAGKIVEIKPGLILGLVSGSPQSRVYKFDLQAGKLVFVKDIDGTLFGKVRGYDRRVIKGPDGYVWVYLNKTICRINPADGKMERIINAPPAGNLLFFHGDLYIYGNTDLRRIRGVFQEHMRHNN